MQTRCAVPAFQGECVNIGSTGHVDDEAMDYLLHDNTAAAGDVVYALQNDSFTCSYERSNVGGQVLAYDYISEQSVKDDIEDRLADCAVTISNTLGTNGPHLWHDYTSAAAMALVVLSLYHDPRRATLLAAAGRLFRGNVLQAYAYVDGAWPEGTSYFRSHFFSSDPPRQYVLDALHAWHSAVQQGDIYQTTANDESDWLRLLGPRQSLFQKEGAR
jgi:hypothetical protein